MKRRHLVGLLLVSGVFSISSSYANGNLSLRAELGLKPVNGLQTQVSQMDQTLSALSVTAPKVTSTTTPKPTLTQAPKVQVAVPATSTVNKSQSTQTGHTIVKSDSGDTQVYSVSDTKTKPEPILVVHHTPSHSSEDDNIGYQTLQRAKAIPTVRQRVQDRIERRQVQGPISVPSQVKQQPPQVAATTQAKHPAKVIDWRNHNPTVEKPSSNSSVQEAPKPKTSTWDNFKRSLHVNGFLSAGAGISNTAAKYVQPDRGAINNKVSFASNSLVGLQLTANLLKNVSAVAQFTANGSDTDGNDAYQINTEWAYLRYIVNHSLQVIGGRYRAPVFMYSDVLDVGNAYPMIQLPAEVYRVVPFSNINGLSVTYRHPFSKGWMLQVQPYGGATTSEFDEPAFSGGVPTGDFTTAKFAENNLIGANISISNKHITLRGAILHGKVTGDFAGNNPLPSTDPSQPSYGPVDTNATFFGAGAQVNYKNFNVIGEIVHRQIDGNSYIPSLTGWYVYAGYTYKRFTPNFTIAKLTTTKSGVTAGGFKLDQDQTSLTAGLNYRISPNIVAKIAVSRITPNDGTSGLFRLPPGKKHVYMGRANVDLFF